MSALKNIVIGLLVLNTLLSALSVPLIYLDFNLRRDYIADVLCINRDEPMTVCGGKCYLDLQLEKATEKQDGEATGPERQIEISFFSQELVSMVFSPFSSHWEKDYGVFHNVIFPDSFYGDIFHPPRFS